MRYTVKLLKNKAIKKDSSEKSIPHKTILKIKSLVVHWSDKKERKMKI